MDSLLLRSKTVCRKISDKKQLAEQVKQLLPEIDENNELTITMATKGDITEMVKYHKTKNHNILEETHGECEIIFVFIHNYC